LFGLRAICRANGNLALLLSVTELIRPLKVIPHPAPTSFPGVSCYVFRDGNEMIIAEIQSRPDGGSRAALFEVLLLTQPWEGGEMVNRAVFDADVLGSPEGFERI